MKFIPSSALLVASALSSAFTDARAAAFSSGDVFAAVANGSVQHYDSNLNFIETLKETLNKAKF